MNYPQQSAQGLASLGRGNDSMLMHVTPREVAGLQSLAMAHGGSLTINPQTGLPEAGFFDAVLPMAAGFALGPGGFGLFSGANAALMAGLTVGGLTALASGDLGAGVMAGLGAGGGAGLGSTFAKMGQNAVGGIAPQAAQDAVISNAIQALPANVAQNAATNLGMFNSTGATAAMGAAGNAVPGAALSNFNNLGLSSQSIAPGVNSSVNAMGAAPTSVQIAEAGLNQPLSGFGASGKGFGEFIKDPFDKGFEAFKQAGGKDGVPLTSGEAAYELGSPIASIALSTMEPPVPQPYIDPDTGKYRGPQGQLNLSDRFDTGLRLAEGGTIATGGIRDLYGLSDNQNQAPLSNDGYGLGRLNQLGNQQSLSQAQTLGYAEGGDVGMNLDSLPSLNLNSGTQSGGMGGMGDAMYSFNDKAAMSPVGRMLFEKMPQSARGDFINSGMGAFFGLQERPKQEYYTGSGNLISMYGGDGPQQIRTGDGRTISQGMPGMAQGGYLNGAGDGMSDSIPATIEGKQPARLADGEFVVPADVVSHLGNGSSKAGSKRLYTMLDKVRHARTGNKKQGKEIKADKYLPA